MKTFVTVHTHRFGTCVYLYKATDALEPDELAKALDLDYEPDRDESLESIEVDYEIPILEPA